MAGKMIRILQQRFRRYNGMKMHRNGIETGQQFFSISVSDVSAISLAIPTMLNAYLCHFCFAKKNKNYAEGILNLF